MSMVSSFLDELSETGCSIFSLCVFISTTFIFIFVAHLNRVHIFSIDVLILRRFISFYFFSFDLLFLSFIFRASFASLGVWLVYGFYIVINFGLARIDGHHQV